LDLGYFLKPSIIHLIAKYKGIGRNDKKFRRGLQVMKVLIGPDFISPKVPFSL
jgi:hypothetical protein